MSWPCHQAVGTQWCALQVQAIGGAMVPGQNAARPVRWVPPARARTVLAKLDASSGFGRGQRVRRPGIEFDPAAPRGAPAGSKSALGQLQRCAQQIQLAWPTSGGCPRSDTVPAWVSCTRCQARGGAALGPAGCKAPHAAGLPAVRRPRWPGPESAAAPPVHRRAMSPAPGG